MISLRTLAQQATRTSLPATRQTLPSQTLADRQTYSGGLQQTPSRYSQPQPTPSYTVPVRREPVSVLSEVRRPYQPSPMATTHPQRVVFPADDMLPQIRSFRGQLGECCATSVIYSVLLMLPVGYFLGLKLSFQLALLIALMLYVKILEPGFRQYVWVYYPLLLLFLLTFYTDCSSDSSIFTIGSLVYCVPAVLLLVYFKWRELTTNESYGILGVWKLAASKTFKDIRCFSFLRGLLISLLFSTVGAYSFGVVEFKNLHLSFPVHLLLSHLVMLYVVNLINEVDVWSDITDSHASRFSSDMLMSFWMLRLEDPKYLNEQSRALKHVNVLLRSNKGLMHNEISKNSFGQRKNWDIFLRYAAYRLEQTNTIINDYRSEIFKARTVIRDSKSILQDAFIYFRKLRNLLRVDRLVKLTEEELAATNLIYDTLVKAISYSRSGIERVSLEEPPAITSRIRSIFEAILEIFRYEKNSSNLLKKYAVYCLNVMEFFEGAEHNLRGLQQQLSEYLSENNQQANFY